MTQSRARARLSGLLIILATSLSLAGANLFIIVWKIDLLAYLGLVLLTSFLLGMTTADTRKASIIACVSLVLGIALTVALMVAPPILLAEGGMAINTAIETTLFTLAKSFLFFVIVLLLLGALAGSLLGEHMEPFTEDET